MSSGELRIYRPPSFVHRRFLDQRFVVSIPSLPLSGSSFSRLSGSSFPSVCIDSSGLRVGLFQVHLKLQFLLHDLRGIQHLNANQPSRLIEIGVYAGGHHLGAIGPPTFLSKPEIKQVAGRVVLNFYDDSPRGERL